MRVLIVDDTPDRRFDDAAKETLEVLAAMTAAVVMSFERTELVQVAMAARELAYVLNNRLGVAVGTLDLIAREDSLSPELQEMALLANGELHSASAQVHQFQRQRLTRGDAPLPTTSGLIS